MKICKNCGKVIDDKAVICVNCGASAKTKIPIYKKWWFWLIIIFIFIGTVTSDNSNNNPNSTTDNISVTDISSKPEINDNKPVTESIPQEFSEACPVSVSADIYDNIIGVPELELNIKNNTEKEIAAIQIYFLPQDVYGDDVDTLFTTNKLYTDTPIGAGKSSSSSWQMLDQNVKSGTVYIYSVYFSDETEWGDRNASVSKIKKYAMQLEASY